jgi:hypothetical protein
VRGVEQLAEARAVMQAKVQSRMRVLGSAGKA